MLSRLGGEPAHFGIRSLRHGASLGDVRDELEAALGVRFEANGVEGELIYECKVPACVLRLNMWASEAAKWRVFHFIGVPDPESSAPHGEDISAALATQLRTGGRDWYVPSKNEFLEEAGVLKDALVDRDAVVALLQPRWLSWASPEERASGTKLLESIASEWLSAALRSSNPGRYLRRRMAELQDRYVPPSSRLRVLAAYLEQR